MTLQILAAVVLLVFSAAILPLAMRYLHDLEVRHLWKKLRTTPSPDVFSPQLVEGLPEPARRFLLNTIEPGAPLAGAVELKMRGQIALKPGASKHPFTASQVLSTDGLIWKASVRKEKTLLLAEDIYAHGKGAMRWYLWKVVPLVRAEDEKVARSLAGRLALEIPLMLPSALVPRAGIRWEAVDENRARVHMRIGGETFSPLLLVDEYGCLKSITLPRWDSTGQGTSQERTPWVLDQFDRFGEFNGYRIPTRSRATRHPETDRADPFFETEIDSVKFLPTDNKNNN